MTTTRQGMMPSMITLNGSGGCIERVYKTLRLDLPDRRRYIK